MKTNTVTIGIPAYNEESNIGFLIRDILSQKITNFKLTKIIVASDGSSDETVNKVRSFKDVRIQIIDGKQRLGKSARQNEIMSRVKSDVLVLLDADIVISDKTFLEKMVTLILEGKCDMTSSGLSELPARTFFEKSLDVSMKLKSILFENFKNGNNVYNCHGPARAFGKDMYSVLRFEQSEGEDMFSYLYCIRLNKEFRYVKNAFVGYQLPSSPIDHYKQSKRYLDALEYNQAFFGQDLMMNEVVIPKKAYLTGAYKAFPYLMTHALFVFSYIVIYFAVMVANLLRIKTKESWDVSSSKSIHI